MIILSDENIQEYQRLVLRRHGKLIAKKQAEEEAMKLITFIGLAYRVPNKN